MGAEQQASLGASSSGLQRLGAIPMSGDKPSLELIVPAQSPSRLADGLAVFVAGLMVLGTVFIAWVLFAPGASNVLKP